MSLETDIQTAYEEQEAVETAARELEARISRIDGAARLMPARAYGKPIDRDALAKSLTLRSLLDQRDELIQQRIWLQNELDNVGAG